MAKVVVNPGAILRGDTRFRLWAKVLTGVDRDGTNGYAFSGDFIRLDRKIELEIGALIMFFHESGSMKYHNPIVELWEVTESGLVQVYNSGKVDKSWVLDVREKIADIFEAHQAKTGQIDRAALEAEAAELRKRLAEIEQLLAR